VSPAPLRRVLGCYLKSRTKLQARPYGASLRDAYARGLHKLGASVIYWAIVFLIIALVAAFLGFFGVATAAAGIAKILFYIFLIMFLVSLIVGVSRRGTRA